MKRIFGIETPNQSSRQKLKTMNFISPSNKVYAKDFWKFEKNNPQLRLHHKQLDQFIFFLHPKWRMWNFVCLRKWLKYRKAKYPTSPLLLHSSNPPPPLHKSSTPSLPFLHPSTNPPPPHSPSTMRMFDLSSFFNFAHTSPRRLDGCISFLVTRSPNQASSNQLANS